MKKISNWSLIGYLTGIFIIFFMSVRYFWIYPDISQAIIYIFAGIVIMAFAWIYNKILFINNSIDNLEIYISEKWEKENVSE